MYRLHGRPHVFSKSQLQLLSNKHDSWLAWNFSVVNPSSLWQWWDRMKLRSERSYLYFSMEKALESRKWWGYHRGTRSDSGTHTIVGSGCWWISVSGVGCHSPAQPCPPLTASTVRREPAPRPCPHSWKRQGWGGACWDTESWGKERRERETQRRAESQRGERDK